MKLEHTALWAADIERLKDFYCTYFQAQASDKYINQKKEFSSYFLSFDGEGRIEIMQRPGLAPSSSSEAFGWAHIAISVGSRDKVDELTERLRSDGYTVAGEPRTTGDGYYESVILDPEGNRIEITV